ncbi:hypothetical protein [Haliangium ochraceum]|uniref:Uncharacterized protein n=1 Tax=Haliangium ochraceum (strain DSM 14365 / JCM 11303 / SMP-2) TaxID=502025 RepID=D0LFS8_HALO1|nr:hypothetical protein [Haliangium ochraceum]ACY14530.1 hypothetical protein Hoch_1984 [Haliangium ochraceum DSM 14365]
MRSAASSRLLALAIALLCAPAPALAQADEASAERDAPAPSADSADSADNSDNAGADDAERDDIAERDYGERRQGSDRDLQYRWRTAGRHYVVPLAFFSIHGYLEGVFAGPSPDWTAADPTQLAAPGQLLVPNTPDSSFQYDAALFISTDISAHTRSLIELHLVSDPGGSGAAGPGGLTIALTEASASWDLYKSYLTLGGGLFWAPFGIVNTDWLGGQSLFSLVPRASAAFPTHYNERGVRINGAAALARGFGINYVVSYGNGVSSFGIDGQNAWDTDGSKTVIGRLGIFPGLGPDLEIGLSYGYGELRDAETDIEREGSDYFGDARRYPGKFEAVGGDLVWKLSDLKLRSYLILSTEVLEPSAGVSPPNIGRRGFMSELSYEWWVELPVGHIRSIVPKARFDWFAIDALAGDGLSTTDMQSSVYSAGVELRSAGTVGAVLSLEYHHQDEFKGFAEPLDNDRIVARLLAKF